jgi:Fe-S-cluster containining protein
MKDCTCIQCVDACKRSPGWFAPGEAEQAAKLLNIEWEFFRKRLVLDYWQYRPTDPYVYAPRKKGEERHIRSTAETNTVGVCTFLENDRCQIHAAKPFECRSAMLCEKAENVRKEISEMWRNQKVEAI